MIPKILGKDKSVLLIQFKVWSEEKSTFQILNLPSDFLLLQTIAFAKGFKSFAYSVEWNYNVQHSRQKI